MKAAHKQAIRERAERALADLYHNATPKYPRLDDAQSEQFESWFSDAVSFEIDYIRGGGASAVTAAQYRRTLEHPANAGRFKSAAARAYYVRKGLRDWAMERARCNRLDSRQSPVNAHWERITEYGKLYQWGRGGRTLAPSDLIQTRGGSSFMIRHSLVADLSIRECLDLIQVLESFNRYVKAWCESVPDKWAEYWAENFGGADVESTAELSTTD
jgi:hypothetical protein